MLLKAPRFHFLWLNNIPLCVCMCVCDCIHTYKYICIQPHILYPLISRHLGCFHILAVLNSATRNMAVHISFQISVFHFLQRDTQKWVVKAKHRETGMKFISSSFRNVCKAMYDVYLWIPKFLFRNEVPYTLMLLGKEEINNRLWPKGRQIY